MSKTSRGVSSVLFESLESRSLLSAVIPYTAFDAGAGPASARPNTKAEAALFDKAAGAIGKESIINFESLAVQSFTKLTVASGVTAAGKYYNGKPLQILGSVAYPAGPSLAGYNTTAGGSKFLELNGGTVKFSFAKPISYFAAFFPGSQSFYADNITFSDGAAEKVNIPVGTLSAGGCAFAGFVDPGASITSVTITASSGASWDAVGIDDIRFGSQSGALSITPPANQTASAGVATPVKLGSLSAVKATAPYKVTINWGDGSAASTVSLKAAGVIPALSHKFAKGGVFTVTEVASDAKGNKSPTVSFVDTVTASLGSIAGVVFNDANSDGKRETTELGLGLWKVYLDLNKNGKLDTGDVSATTDINGKFSFAKLAAGTYELRIVPVTGDTATTPTLITVTLAAGQNLTTELFGEK
jgi:hypothetical protein